MQVFVGTSGYAYKAWKGSFYPEDLPASEMLRHYAGRFRTVEINNTFYRMPSAKRLAAWSGQVPDGFRFVLKASRRITHDKRLVDVEDPVSYLLGIAAELGDKLGPLLYQLPPNFRKDLPRLQDFLVLLTGGPRAAIEFRHPSWFDDEVFDALRSCNVALCIADTGEERDAPVISTADWGYLRLRRDGYSESELGAWAERIRSLGGNDAFIFLKHEELGAGPELAARLMGMFG